MNAELREIISRDDMSDEPSIVQKINNLGFITRRHEIGMCVKNDDDSIEWQRGYISGFIYKPLFEDFVREITKNEALVAEIPFEGENCVASETAGPCIHAEKKAKKLAYKLGELLDTDLDALVESFSFRDGNATVNYLDVAPPKEIVRHTVPIIVLRVRWCSFDVYNIVLRALRNIQKPDTEWTVYASSTNPKTTAEIRSIFHANQIPFQEIFVAPEDSETRKVLRRCRADNKLVFPYVFRGGECYDRENLQTLFRTPVTVPRYNIASKRKHFDENRRKWYVNVSFPLYLQAKYPYVCAVTRKLKFTPGKAIWAAPEVWPEINNCLTRDARFIIIPLTLKGSEGSHMNYLIYDNSSGTMERFEPHGWGVKLDYAADERIDLEVQKAFANKISPDFIRAYVPTSDFCPKVGPQRKERAADALEMDLPGYCIFWNFWFLDLRAANPNVSRNEIASYMLRSVEESGVSYKEFIRRYTKYLEGLYEILESYGGREIDYYHVIQRLQREGLVS